jgi:hypothetical protein
MMMSKPTEESKTQYVEESPAAPSIASRPSTKTGSVEDLERRLAMLGESNAGFGFATAPAAGLKDPPPMQAPAPVVAATTSAPAGGKNALLVRERKILVLLFLVVHSLLCVHCVGNLISRMWFQSIG